MKYYDRLVLKKEETYEDHFPKVKMIIKLLALERKCNFKEIDYEENKEMYLTHTWLDEKKELEITFSKNLTIPANSIVVQSNDKELWERFIDFLAEKMDPYAVESMMGLTQELIKKNHYLLRICSLGTYFIKPYPQSINFLISENLFSDDRDIVKSAIAAAGLAKKEIFIYDLLEAKKDHENDEEVLRFINESLEMIEYARVNTPEFFTLD